MLFFYFFIVSGVVNVVDFDIVMGYFWNDLDFLEIIG